MSNITGFFRSLFGGNNLNGSLGILEDERDFLISSTDLLPELDKQDTIIFEYNQGSSNDCTIYSAVGALSDLMNYEFSAQEIKEINELSYIRGRKRGEGRYTNLGVKCVCDYWNNKYPDKPVRYDKLILDSQETENVLNKNYTVCTTFKGNSKYNLEYLKYLAIKSRDFGVKTYGHAINMIKRDNKRFMKDSYKGRETKYGKSNIYEIQVPIGKLIPDTYYPAAYLISKIKTVDKLEELKRLKELEIDINKAIEINSEIRHNLNDENLKEDLHLMNEKLRKKINDIKIEFEKRE